MVFHMYKVCTKCKIESDETCFYKRSASKGGLDSWCKPCCIESSQARYRKTRTERLAKGKLRYNKNKEQRLAYSRAYYEKNKERQLKLNLEWQKKNPEVWREIRYKSNLKRRAQKRTTSIEPISPQKVFEVDMWICGLCYLDIDPTLKWPEEMSASIDHILPLSKGGGHMYSNLQASHYICNVRKNARVGG